MAKSKKGINTKISDNSENTSNTISSGYINKIREGLLWIKTDFIYEDNKLDYKRLGLIVSPILSIVLFILYCFGYMFLYGYYFNEQADRSSVFSVLMTNIPFNYKVLVFLGLIVILAAALLYPSMKSFINALINVNLKEALSSAIITLIVVLFEYFVLIVMMNGINNVNESFSSSIQIFYTILILLNFTALNIALKYIELFISMLYLFISSFIFLAYFSTENLQLAGVLLLIIANILVFIKSNTKKVIFPIIYIILFKLILQTNYILLILDSLYKKYGIITLQISSILLALLVLLIINMDLILKRFNIIRVKKNAQNMVLKFIDEKSDKALERVLPIIAKFAIVIIIPNLIILMFMFSYLIMQAGQVVEEQIPDTSLKLITYNNGKDNKTIVGRIVATKDKTYYISDEKEKLVIVSSGSIEIVDYKSETNK